MPNENEQSEEIYVDGSTLHISEEVCEVEDGVLRIKE